MTSAPYWMTFPTHALQVDWSDHGAAHRAVMSLFEKDLPGDLATRRATGQILYRLDHHVDGTSTVLLQTRQAIQTAPPAARATTVPAAAWDLPQGATVLFRVAVNAIRRRTEHDDTGRRRETVTNIPFDEAATWVTEKIAPVLATHDLLSHVRTTSRTRRKERKIPPRLVLDTVDGIATVTDPEALRRLRLDGIGRGKAYGAGLLTVRPLG